jgi:hypothetical protein
MDGLFKIVEWSEEAKKDKMCRVRMNIMYDEYRVLTNNNFSYHIYYTKDEVEKHNSDLRKKYRETGFRFRKYKVYVPPPENIPMHLNSGKVFLVPRKVFKQYEASEI